MPPELERLHKPEQDHESKLFEVTDREATEIRWAVVSYLNSLETILAAARHNVADREMLYEQFKYLINPKEDHYLLSHFRDAVGGAKTYPSLDEFAKSLKDQVNESAPGKDRVA